MHLEKPNCEDYVHPANPVEVKIIIGDPKRHYMLTIKPAIGPKERHQIEDVLKNLGYHVIGGGTCVDMSECDISFEK